jgi:hypothetical protein
MGNVSIDGFIDPVDACDRLFVLSLMAGVLVALPSGLRSESATSCLFEHCRVTGVPYGWVDHGAGTRMIWGFEGRASWAVATRPGSRRTALFDMNTPITMNCTGFANVMLSVWQQGNIHQAPYDASQAVGGFNPLGLRYNMHQVGGSGVLRNGVFRDADTLNQFLEQDRIYHFGICNLDGFITHDTVLLNGYVYECNLGQEPAVYRTALADRFKKAGSRKGARVFGPAPF